MSETPRTDALLAPLRGSCAFTGPCAEHARQLERELNAAKAENESMRVAIKAAHKSLFYVSPVFGRTPAQDAVLAKLQPFLK